MHKKIEADETYAAILRDIRGSLHHMYPTSDVRLSDNESVAITDTRGGVWRLVLYAPN